MDEQTRATFILAAATLTATQIEGQSYLHDPVQVVEKLNVMLDAMIKSGLVPVGIHQPHLGMKVVLPMS